MSNLIAILAGEPNSINSEIIAKAWKNKKKLKNIFIIGNYSILKKQILKLNIKIPLVKIEKFEDFRREEKLFVLDVPLKFTSAFNANLTEVQFYIFRSFDVAHNLAIDKKILGFINAPIDKKIFNNRYLGVTEYLSEKNKCKNKEVMLIFNKKLSVVPLTTHIEIKNVTRKITFSLIKTKMVALHKSYYKLFKKKPKIAILGLNPHNSEKKINSVENKIITPAIVKVHFLQILHLTKKI
jgi:4-hydroxy-L-threonine phosphate dehydrogenase PdxA